MCESSPEIIKPFLLGCDTKQSKIIQLCLTSVQKVIEAKILNLVRKFNHFFFFLLTLTQNIYLFFEFI